MATNYKTPGVYIKKKNAFPSSAVAVETAVPVFIGYTEIATTNGKSLVDKPTRISSFAEYTQMFGEGFKAKFTVEASKDHLISISQTVKIKHKNITYMYNSIRLFYSNGGSTCYILSVGTYKDSEELEIKASDFNKTSGVLDLLLKEEEPTLVVMPDAIALGEECYTSIYTEVLNHCKEVKNRFGIFDLLKQAETGTTEEVVDLFRDKIGVNFLNYGAAYYPWLKTTIVQPSELDFRNIDEAVDLAALLPENDVKEVVEKFKALAKPNENDRRNYDLELKATSLTYVQIMIEIKNYLNELPPSGAIAGIYTLVDTSRGVWKAPANVSLSNVSAPSVNISSKTQENLNVDAISGKSINVIRSFPRMGTLVWGARTLDGNSPDWSYINVRRTLIMIEQSLKLASRGYVFEPNDANTWITVKSMFNNFLTNLWKQGALAGDSPVEAFDVQIGLGATMTSNDILDGYMLITVKIAIVRPAEFIVITFQQQMQQS